MNTSAQNKFLAWELQTRDTVDFKKIYVDMAGDIFGGLVLSEIVYWHLPTSSGNSRLRVKHNGVEWIACPRYEWWDRTRLSPRQLDRALTALVKSNVIVKKYFAFNGARTTHVRINWDAFILLWDSLLNAPLENPYAPKKSQIEGSTHQTVTTQISVHQTVNTETNQGKLLPIGDSVVTKSATPITESTTETTRAVEAPAQETLPPAKEHSYAAELEGYNRRFDFYHAFEAGFPRNARTRIPDSSTNKRLAQQIYLDGYTPEEVTALVQSKLAQGKTNYRFQYLPEDLGGFRQERDKQAKVAPPKFHRAPDDLIAAFHKGYERVH